MAQRSRDMRTRKMDSTDLFAKGVQQRYLTRKRKREMEETEAKKRMTRGTAEGTDEIMHNVDLAALNIEAAKDDDTTANSTCTLCQTSDVFQGKDFLGCFGCGKLYKQDQTCCAAPRIEEDELGMSCKNCGESVGLGRAKISSIILDEDRSDRVVTAQSQGPSSEVMLPCCGISVSFARVFKDTVRCLNCKELHLAATIFSAGDDKDDKPGDEKSDVKDGENDKKMKTFVSIHMRCCDKPRHVREPARPRKRQPGYDSDAKQSRTETRCLNCRAVQWSTEGRLQGASDSEPDNANLEVDEKQVQQLAKAYDPLGSRNQTYDEDMPDYDTLEYMKEQSRIRKEKRKKVQEDLKTFLDQKKSVHKDDSPANEDKCQDDGQTVDLPATNDTYMDEDIGSGDRTFTLFPKFPAEIRDHIYELVLCSDKAIAPHLCGGDESSIIRFHDNNQAKHGAVYESMHITRVSRKIRAESLPIFYRVNTFDVVTDTPTYFLRLQQLGRFHMIHNVSFVLPFWNDPDYTQKVLRMLLQNITDQEKYEKPWSFHAKMLKDVVQSGASALVKNTKGKLKNTIKTIGLGAADNTETSVDAPHVVPHKRDPSKFYTDSLQVLTSHPLHIMGGLEPGFVVLRMLSMALEGNDYNRKLVVHVPAAEFFDQYNGLLYFPAVCEGLGIQLQFVSGREVELTGGGFRLGWHRKYQKKDFTDMTTAKSGDEEYKTIVKRVQTLYPKIEKVSRPSRRTYYRRMCQSDKVEWFTMNTEGGGVF